ncbi:MAG TPA: type II toxin-antitoxin system Phd/YefM family antitoxin [Gammaproteobacteria bacterium]|nr:type II toxin-antitoxin system Phd/YefM family antitoxin [Gammaproteobacteria bacterium]
MSPLTVSEARTQLYNLVDEVSLHHEPVLITGKRHNAILVSEEDWSSIQETLFLMSIPNMRESIKRGLETPPDACDRDLDW